MSSDYDRDDDRPRRRDDDYDRPRKKGGKGWLIALLVIGGLVVVCGGGCAVGGYFYFKAVMDLVKTPDQFLTKLRTNDYQGAYDMTTAGYKSRYTLAQFTDAMKKAKLDQNSGVSGSASSNQTGNNSLTITAGVGVPGKTTTVTFKMLQEGGPTEFKIDDITGPDISYTGTDAKKAP